MRHRSPKRVVWSTTRGTVVERSRARCEREHPTCPACLPDMYAAYHARHRGQRRAT